MPSKSHSYFQNHSFRFAHKIRALSFRALSLEFEKHWMYLSLHSFKDITFKEFQKQLSVISRRLHNDINGEHYVHQL